MRDAWADGAGPRVAEAVLARPAPALAGLVGSYVGYRYEGFPPGEHVGLPGRWVTLVVSLHDPIEVRRGPGGGAPRAHDLLVGGLCAEPVVIGHAGTQVGIHVNVAPHAVPLVLGCPPSTVTEAVGGLEDLLPAAVGRELSDRVRAAPTWPRRFAVLDDVLTRVVRGRHRAHRPVLRPEVSRVWTRLVGSGGRTTVTDLAQEVGWSRRHLTGQVTAGLGLPPKVLARIVRFERVADALKVDPTRPLADLAVSAGYSDQPHMTRDFTALAGLSPTRWLAEEVFPFVQDTGATGEEDGAHGR